MQLDSLLMVTMNVMKERIVEAYATGGKGRLQLRDAAALLINKVGVARLIIN